MPQRAAETVPATRYRGVAIEGEIPALRMVFHGRRLRCDALAVADSLSEEVRAFLVEGTRTGKLGTLTASGWPHVMPIWFVLDDDELVFSTGRDTVKGRYIRRAHRRALRRPGPGGGLRAPQRGPDRAAHTSAAGAGDRGVRRGRLVAVGSNA